MILCVFYYLIKIPVLGKCFFFYLGFLSQTFMIQRTAGEGGGYLFNSSLPLFLKRGIAREHEVLLKVGGFFLKLFNCWPMANPRPALGHC